MGEPEKEILDIVVEFTYVRALPPRNPPTHSTFSGGLEMLFENKNKHKINIPANDPQGSPTNIKSLVHHLCDNVMRDSRKELFVVDGSVYSSFFRPRHRADRIPGDRGS
jgi:Urm1 (Ubiquitin related modifier)